MHKPAKWTQVQHSSICTHRTASVEFDSDRKPPGVNNKMLSQIEEQICLTFYFRTQRFVELEGRKSMKKDKHTQCEKWNSTSPFLYTSTLCKRQQQSTCNDLSLVLWESTVNSAWSHDLCRPFFRASVSWKMVCRHVLFQKNALGNTDVSFMCSAGGEDGKVDLLVSKCPLEASIVLRLESNRRLNLLVDMLVCWHHGKLSNPETPHRRLCPDPEKSFQVSSVKTHSC